MGYGAGEQPSGPVKLTWRQAEGQSPPEVNLIGLWRTTAVHGSTAYFSINGFKVYSYTVPENKWTELPQCKHIYFAMAVVNNALTTIGGCLYGQTEVSCNTLLSLSGSSWKEILPPMPTKRAHPAAVRTPTHLVVAGGDQSLLRNCIANVEVLNTETLQWSTAKSLPEAVRFPQMTTCGGRLYLADDDRMLSCSVGALLNSSDGGSLWSRVTDILMPVWTRLASIPAYSSLATLRGRVLAVGGGDGEFNRSIRCYDVATNSWSVIGELPTPRCLALTAVLPSNELVVVGGWTSGDSWTTTEIGNS